MITLAGSPTLQTDRLVLRAPQAGDWPVFRDFLGHPRSTFIRDGDTLDDAKIWRAFCHITGTWVARGYGSFVITRKGEDTALGLTGPWHPIEWPERELGWTIWSEAAEGQGIAFEAATAARAHVFRDLGWKTAVSYIDPDNARSIALAKRLGCTPDAKAPFPGKGPCLVYRHPDPGGRA
ncbi:MAG: GNAT family N-acetyltransferase [Tabrizicola sp.]|nr:GNAT family N-acetyltransferase [Tabrizicola sp.]